MLKKILLPVFVLLAFVSKAQLPNEPQQQPQNMTFTGVKSYKLTVNYSAPNPACDGYIVLKKNFSPVTEAPIDSVAYNIGDYIGNAKVAYMGNSLAFANNNTRGEIETHFAVFAFNGSGANINYLQTNPLTGNVIPTFDITGTYYNNITVHDSDLVTKLTQKIGPHLQVSYDSFKTNNIPNFSSIDTAGGSQYVSCVYSGQRYTYNGTFYWIGSGGGIFSREHTFPQSWMETVTGIADIEGRAEHSDQHALFPVNQNQVNGVRSNHPYGEVTTVTSQFLEGKLGYNAAGQTVYEPREAFKGDAARALMYMCIAYDKRPTGKRWFLPSQQNEAILKKWHFQDPPDYWERTRNDYVASLQNNRNPFVDSTQYACFIKFSNLSYYLDTNYAPCKQYYVAPIDTGSVDTNNVGIKSLATNLHEVVVYPNPNDGNFSVSFSSDVQKEMQMDIFSVMGENIYSAKHAAYFGLNEWQFNLKFNHHKILIVRLYDGKNYYFEKIVSR